MINVTLPTSAIADKQICTAHHQSFSSTTSSHFGVPISCMLPMIKFWCLICPLYADQFWNRILTLFKYFNICSLCLYAFKYISKNMNNMLDPENQLLNTNLRFIFQIKNIWLYIWNKIIRTTGFLQCKILVDQRLHYFII